MRQTFKAGIELKEQRDRVADAKQPGRKHQKRKGPTRLTEVHNAAKKTVVMRMGKVKKRSQQVAAFWRGELDEFPK